MPTPKQQAIDLVSALPDDCTYEDIQYHLYAREKIERGLRDVAAGNVLSQAEMEAEYRQWLKGIKKP